MTLKRAVSLSMLCKMNKFIIIIGLIFSIQSHATERHFNPLFSQSHLLPSPYTLSAGQFVYGSQLALGITDFLQISTDFLRDLFQIYNAQLKVNLVDTSLFAWTLSLGFQTFNYQDIDSSNPAIQITSYRPGTVFAFGLGSRVAWFLGGSADLSNQKKSTNVQTSGFVQGHVIESDWSFAYKTKDDEPEYGYAIAVGGSYDLTYKLIGVGLSHHWPSFRIGVHYYINADRSRILPLITGGGTLFF